MHKIIQTIRGILPLSIRKRIGPYIAYIVYLIKVYILVNRKRPHVLSLNDTVERIKVENLSVIRFGDGEMSAIENHDLPFQKRDSELSEKLLEILKSDKPGLLICIPGIFEKLNNFTKSSFWFTLHHLFKYGYLWNKYLPLNKIYGDAFITRPYLTYKDKSQSEQIFGKMISLWDNEEVVLVEGSKSRLGVGNDLFSKVKSLGRILCPAENAYSKYNDILAATKRVNKDKLILLSVGPTAKILAYDLFQLGYRVIDIGHIDMEYEMFLRKENRLVKVKYKYFNEIEEREPEDCTDSDYLNQIIEKVD